MNPHTALFLIRKDCRAMLCAYEAEVDGKLPQGEKPRMFKTLDPDIKKGDLVLCETETRHKLCVFKVHEVDVDVDFRDGAYHAPIPWIVDKVNGNTLAGLKAAESEIMSRIRQKDKERLRAEMAATMAKDYGDAFSDLPIAIQAQPAPDQ